MSGVKHARLEVTKKKPTAAEIEIAEIAINLEDKLLYTKNQHGEIIPVGGSGGGMITQNMNVLTEDFALDDGFSGVVASGFKIAVGVTLTIPVGSTLVVL